MATLPEKYHFISFILSIAAGKAFATTEAGPLARHLLTTTFADCNLQLTLWRKDMHPDQTKLVQSTWAMVAPIADAAATLFYDRLFTIDPATRSLFRNTDLPEQRKKLVQAMSFVVNGLEHPEGLLATLEDLGRRHAGYGVTNAHYDTVGAALLWTLEQGIPSAWTSEAKDAWTAAYGIVADAMRRGASFTAVSPAAAPHAG
jgi:hemoglobin-like flavoprotein